MAGGSLASHLLFQRMHRRWRALLLAAARPQLYPKGATIFCQGQRADAMWLVLDGWVHLVRAADAPPRTRSQAGAVLFTITPDEALCGISAIGSDLYEMSAVAGTRCRVARLPGHLFAQAIRRDAGLATEVVRLCARRIQHIARQYGAMAEPVRYRLIRAILRLQEQFGEEIPVTHRELALMAWTTTESAIRTVRALKISGYVAGARGRLSVRRSGDLEALLWSTGQHDSGHSVPRGGEVPYVQRGGPT